MDSPHLILDSPIFRGVEREGPFTGTRTLFIASSAVGLSNIEGYLSTVQAVYFGAGRLGCVNWSLLRALAERNTHLVTVELGGRHEGELNSLRLTLPSLLHSQHLVVLTAKMDLPNGTLFSLWPAAHSAARELVAAGAAVALKVDNGKSIHIGYRGASLVNNLDASYAEDERLQLL